MARFRILAKSKIQRLVVTDKNLRYEGSLELDRDLLKAADILPGEIVQVVNLNNGNRFETYVIPAPAGSGACVLNGGAARLGEAGDELIVMSSTMVDETEASMHQMRRVVVNEHNHIIDLPSTADYPDSVRNGKQLTKRKGRS
ncbi:MAG: aspartate 1-decarboxylase [candidate division WOR-3 bacterium]